MADQRRGPWSQAEDRYLMKLVETQGALNWVKISSLLGSRTPKQCRERYHQNLKPSLNHDPITPEEGAVIEQLVTTIGKRWAEIARRLHNRSDNAVKNWWNGSMNRRRRMVRRRVPAYDDVMDTQTFARTPSRLQLSNISTYPSHPGRTSPLGTTTSGYHQHHHHHHHHSWGSHSGLPSPTNPSPGSDSLLDGAPSLVSDTGSYYSVSPTTTGPPDSPGVELPPLKNDGRPAYLGTAPESTFKLPSSHSYLPPIRDALMDGRHQLPTAPNSPVAIPLPKNHEPNPSEVSLDNSMGGRSSRMKLSSILCE